MSKNNTSSSEVPASASDIPVVQDSIESRLLLDYHLTREEIKVIRKAYLERRKELFRATRQELQDFINQDYRLANEEVLGGPEGVRILQIALNRANTAVKKPEILVDGQFGPSTFRTLIDFQKRVGLTPDGIAGLKTIEFLEIAQELPNFAKPSVVEPAPVVEPTPVVVPVKPPGPDVEKIIGRFEARMNGIRANQISLRTARDENTGIFNVLIDGGVGALGGDTGMDSYERSWNEIRNQTRTALAELKLTIGNAELTEKEKIRYDRLNQSYTKLLKSNLGGPEFVASAIASAKALPDDAISAGYGMLGIAK